MSWADSLIRISDYTVEGLRKRLGEIAQRKADLELRLAILDAEAEVEAEEARKYAEAGWYHVGYLQGWRMRRSVVEADLRAAEQEELGARDALTQAYEELKKYEQVAEGQRLLAAKDRARRETAALDEMGLRRAAR